MRTQTLGFVITLATSGVSAAGQADIYLAYGYGNNFAYGYRYYDSYDGDRQIDRIERSYDRNLGDCLAQTGYLSNTLQSEALARQALAGEVANARINASVTEDDKGVEVLPKAEFDALQDKYERLMGAYVNLQRAYRDATGETPPATGLSQN